jgi:hypothetical protein
VGSVILKEDKGFGRFEWHRLWESRAAATFGPSSCFWPLLNDFRIWRAILSCFIDEITEIPAFCCFRIDSISPSFSFLSI